MKPKLSNLSLVKEAKKFCQLNSGKYRKELFGVTDGKAIGTFVEHLFKDFLSEKYDLVAGNSAKGLDLPSINTDIKVTSLRQPQSSCPFKDSKQKIYGLGYNLIVFVYKKYDDPSSGTGMLEFVSCTFIEAQRTGDYQITTGLHNIIKNNGNEEDIFAFLNDHHIPADETTLYQMAEEIFHTPPPIGYLTISNALQWRLQYGRVISLEDKISGIKTIIPLKNDKPDKQDSGYLL